MKLWASDHPLDWQHSFASKYLFFLGNKHKFRLLLYSLTIPNKPLKNNWKFFYSPFVLISSNLSVGMIDKERRSKLDQLGRNSFGFI